ncbi:MAG: hypothetical protein AB7G06_00235 [Bdellovibrionales bacterium]
MSEIAKTNRAAVDLNTIREKYKAGSADGLMRLGTEVEQWLVNPANNQTPLRMMTPWQSQGIFRELASRKDSVVFSEKQGVRVPGIIDGRPLVCVDAGGISYQLELCGVLEAATRPVELEKLPELFKLLDSARTNLDALANKAGLAIFDGAVLTSATVADCEANMVERERLQAEWGKFKAQGPDAAGLRTMGLATSAQVSLSYRDAREADEIITLANYLSPLLIGAFDNSARFVENRPTNKISRAQWWLDHNKDAPRGGIPAPILEAMESSERYPGVLLDRWIDYIVDVPMVYYIDAEGNPRFDRSPTFRELQAEGLGDQTNFALAESLCWPDVKIIGGQRIELRMCDSGPWQAEGLSAIAATLLACPAGREKTFRLLEETGIDPKTLMESRTAVCTQGLDATFGNTTLRDLLPRLLDLVLEDAPRLGVPASTLKCLAVLRDTETSDAERLRQVPFANAADADAYLTRPVVLRSGDATVNACAQS